MVRVEASGSQQRNTAIGVAMSSRGFGLPNNKNGYSAVAHNMVCDAAESHPRQTRPAARPHDDEINPELPNYL